MREHTDLKHLIQTHFHVVYKTTVKTNKLIPGHRKYRRVKIPKSGPLTAPRARGHWPVP